MIIWVKEVADRVTVKKVRAFVNNDAIIEPFVDMEAVGPEDCKMFLRLSQKNIGRSGV